MHIDLILDEGIFPEFRYDFVRFVFNKIKEDIYKLSNKKRPNYNIRKMLLDQKGIIDKKVLESLDLVDCINNSLELIYSEGLYKIRLNSNKRIKGTNLKLIRLVKLLEFGSLSIPELPVIRRVLNVYREGYNDLFDDFIEEEFST